MEHQLELLIKTLNGGLKHIPDAVNLMVQQYVMQRWAYAAISFVGAAAFLTAGIVALKRSFSIPREHYFGRDEFGLESTILNTIGFVAIGVGALLMVMAARFTGEALAPIYSLIQSLS